jgi:D-mannonate dehydratase
MSDEEILKTNAHIPDSEVWQDIADTEREIEQMTLEAEHLEKTPPTMHDAKMAYIYASARRSGIEGRKQLIEKLRKLMALRNQQIQAK